MKSRMLVSFLVIAVVASLIGGATMAWFTDEDSAGEATFTAGTLSLDVSDGLTAFAALPDIKIDCMNPGDVYPEITITVENTGTKNLAWFGDWRFTPGTGDADKLLDAIYIKTMGSQFLDKNGNRWSDSDPWYQGYNFIVDGRGNDLEFNSGEAAALNAIADLSEFKVITLRNWNDNNLMITLAGADWEHMGALKPGNKYVWNIELGFCKEAGNDYQGNADGVSPITVKFECNATQVNEEAINALLSGLGTTYITWMQNQIAAQPDNN